MLCAAVNGNGSQGSFLVASYLACVPTTMLRSADSESPIRPWKKLATGSKTKKKHAERPWSKSKLATGSKKTEKEDAEPNFMKPVSKSKPRPDHLPAIGGTTKGSKSGSRSSSAKRKVRPQPPDQADHPQPPDLTAIGVIAKNCRRSHSPGVDSAKRRKLRPPTPDHSDNDSEMSDQLSAPGDTRSRRSPSSFKSKPESLDWGGSSADEYEKMLMELAPLASGSDEDDEKEVKRSRSRSASPDDKKEALKEGDEASDEASDEGDERVASSRAKFKPASGGSSSIVSYRTDYWRLAASGSSGGSSRVSHHSGPDSGHWRRLWPSKSKGSKGKSKGKRKTGLLATGSCIHRAARYSQAPSQTFQEAWSLEAQEESYQEFHPALTRTWNPWQVVSRSLQAGST